MSVEACILSLVCGHSHFFLLCCRDSVWLELHHNGDDKHSKDADYVMRYGNERWEVPTYLSV